MMKLAILSTTIAVTAAFAPISSHSAAKSSLCSTPEEDTSDIPADIPQPVPAVRPINGWVPDETAKCYGLPGAVAPTGYFDPLGFAQAGITLNEIKRNREAELMHGRVAMLATVGYFVAEQVPSPFGITGPANDQLQQMPAVAFVMLSSTIAAVEIRRAQIGWVEPDLGDWTKTLWKLRDNLNDIKRNREAEVMHGRVAMLATVGYFVGEQLPSPFGIVGPANDQLQQMPAPVFALFSATIAALEIRRAKIGWVEPDFGDWTKTLWKLRDNYYPGDVGFDPLGLKPTDATGFANMQTRELQNGRLAMIGWAGMCAQELVNHRTIMDTIDFYNKIYSGVNPYENCGADGIIC
eukprot:CAMPEP_0201989072 /NCGR_PEP_ID=MMETSP0904-20121228/92661_1 /ASSEMBLY_ACC=CAM_ASM_000553 /TAXON_ID=420261 /ORGANISM="Thalassiosira antarctica, Strain CCMP982" /LENGTH=350 /DNA_ID=CAMNT_0048543275 /DNA_START=21 /DNA_END=1073 /DNA_ORIENTATION=-